MQQDTNAEVDPHRILPVMEKQRNNDEESVDADATKVRTRQEGRGSPPSLSSSPSSRSSPRPTSPYSYSSPKPFVPIVLDAPPTGAAKYKSKDHPRDDNSIDSSDPVAGRTPSPTKEKDRDKTSKSKERRGGGDSEEPAKRAGKGKKPPREGGSNSSSSRGGEDPLSSPSSASTLGRRSAHDSGAHAESPRGSLRRSNDGVLLASPPTRSLSILLERRERTKSREKDDSGSSSSSEAGDRDERTKGKVSRDRDARDRDRSVDERPKRSGSLILQRPRSATGASPTGIGQQQASSPRKPGRKSPSTDDLVAMSDGGFVGRADYGCRSAGEGSDPDRTASSKKDKTRDKVREEDKGRGDKKWPRSDRDLPKGYSGLEPSASSGGDTTPRRQQAAPRARSSTQSPYKEASHHAGGTDASREADSPRRHMLSAPHTPVPSSPSSSSPGSAASSPSEPSTAYSRSPTSAFLQFSPRAATNQKKKHARHNSESLLMPAFAEDVLGRSIDGGTGDEVNKPSRHPLRSRRVRRPSHSRPKSPKTDEWPEADSEWAEDDDDEREEWERTTSPAAVSEDLPTPMSSRDRKKTTSEDGGGRSRMRESSSEDSESDSTESARDRDRRSRRSRHDDHNNRDKGKTKDRAMHSGGGSPTKAEHQQEPGSHEATSPTKPAPDAGFIAQGTTPPPSTTRPLTGSLTKEDAALLLQKVFRGSLGRKQGRKQALLTAWELLDYDDERKTVRQTERAYKLETMARNSLRELQLKEYFKHRAQKASSGSAESGTSESESEVEVEVEVGAAEQEAQVSVTEDTEEATGASEDEDRDRHQHRKEARGRHGDHAASSSSSSSEGSRTKERRRDGEPSSSSSPSSSSKGSRDSSYDERKKQKEESERDHRARKLRKKKKSLVYFKIDLQPHQPITPKIVSKLINHFKDGEVLDEKDATEILRQMKEWYYKHGSAVVDLDVPEGASLTICGDVHGQLDDALTIFRLNGLPSEQSAYIFNGDLVDRGRYGMEICLLLFAIKLSQEGTLHINRGNHECRRMNERYSFEKEVLLKYDERMFKRIQKVFNQLPIAALIRNKIFVTHGGLFREADLTIDEIRRMDYRMDIPIKANDRMAQAFIDLMWSDPRPTQGIENSKRGAGAYFGPDITAAFIERNSLELVIRSHEMVPWGYSVAHDHKVVTVFSASSYCGTNDNFGAYLTFKHDLVPVFHRFQADSLRNISRTFSAEELKTETTRKLRERIFENRYNLAVAFAQIDEQRTGKVSRIQWAQIMGDVLHLSSMPWLSLQPMLAKASKDRNNAKVIKYKHFLARYQVRLNHQLVDSWEDLLVREVCQKLYDSGENLCEEFKKVDAEDSGLVEREDFVKTIKNLRVGFGDLEIQSLLASCATADDKVNYREWIKRLHVVYTEIEFAHRETEDWLEMAIQEIGMEIVKREEDMDALFKQFDEDQDGELSAKEFDKLLKHLGLNNKHSKVQRERVIRHINKQPKEANITYHDFVTALKVDMDDWRWKERVIQHMCYIFFKNRYELLTVFRSFNTSGSGIINQQWPYLSFTRHEQEFKAGMKTLKKLLNVSLSSVQLEKLYEVIDVDGDGLISIAEFLDTFQVVDIAQENRKASARGKQTRTSSEPA